METLSQENKGTQVLAYVQDMISEKLLRLKEDPEVSEHFLVGGKRWEMRPGNKQDEMAVRLQMQTMAAKEALADCEEAMRGFSTSREMYERTVIAAKLVEVYKRLESFYSVIAEAEEREDKEPNYSGIKALLKDELKKLSDSLN
ncbi:MAG: hypothetical protein WCT49_02330 [Candidatus Paceibacterota bacterium]|jgi:hypothetical protein|nr:hypothetical protein [Candidatus Paceibacterota bacterium]